MRRMLIGLMCLPLLAGCGLSVLGKRAEPKPDPKVRAVEERIDRHLDAHRRANRGESRNGVRSRGRSEKDLLELTPRQCYRRLWECEARPK